MTTSRPAAAVFHTVREAALAELVSAYPREVATIDPVTKVGTCVKTRLQETATAGHPVEACTMEDGRPGYRFTSLVRGLKTTNLAGCILRLTDVVQEPWTARTHGEARRGPIPDEVLDEAQCAAVAAYQGVFRAHGFAHLLGVEGGPISDQAESTPAWMDMLDQLGGAA